MARPPIGSPPLARRAPRVRTTLRTLRRLTSARAESTVALLARWRDRTAHLRSRGEHFERRTLADNIRGSPPLARRAPFATCPYSGALPSLCRSFSSTDPDSLPLRSECKGAPRISVLPWGIWGPVSVGALFLATAPGTRHPAPRRRRPVGSRRHRAGPVRPERCHPTGGQLVQVLI
ncbi:hypothetical protein STAN_7085 [Streptomyces sp. CBMAI 2042]|nr:hypothetical protein STAN_7085 [Streptomyces sp. CBMAI 2042]